MIDVILTILIAIAVAWFAASLIEDMRDGFWW